MKRLAVLVNVISPYRVPLLARLAENFETLVLHGGAEPNRTWTVDLPPTLRTRKVFSLQIPVRKKTGIAGVVDTSYLHLNFGLVWWLLRFRPNVIVSGEMGLRTLLALLYGKLTRTPVWVWWGGTLHSERNITRSRARLRQWLARHVQRWISYGASTTEYLESLGVERERILQIQNCVLQETFQSEDVSDDGKLLRSHVRPVILSVGQLLQRKGLDKLIEACGRLAARGVLFSLVLVGQGPEKERLERLAKSNRLEHFEILPNQSQRVLNTLYRAADVFVLPTLEDVWGLVVNEAMWAGTPVLCSQYAGCARELLPEENIFDPMLPESFDAALNRALTHHLQPPERGRLLTWQEVGALMCRSLETGRPIR